MPRIILSLSWIRWLPVLRALVVGGFAVAAPSGVVAQSLQDVLPAAQVTELSGLTAFDRATSSGPIRKSEATALAIRQLLHQLGDDGKDREYKRGEAWWSRNFQGIDFLEPLIPLGAAANGDIGSIVLDSALPYALLTTAFAARSTDQTTLSAIGRWGWVGIDEKQDNYPVEIGLIALGAAGIFLPSTQTSAMPHYGRLLFDRTWVFVLGFGTAYATTEILKPAIARRRPNGEDSRSRPSSHATVGFTTMAFLSNVLRDALAPHEEANLGIRILKEVATGLPYLGAGYLALERVHGKDHFLTDTLLGGAIGAFSMNMFYAWSFARTRYRDDARSWFDRVSVGYDPTIRGIQILVHGRF